MKYIKFTHVDAVTAISVASEPAANGPSFPDVEGLAFEWARESAYPTSVPHFFGTCPESSDTQIDGVLAVMGKDEYDSARAAEYQCRNENIKQDIVAKTQARLTTFAATRGYSSLEAVSKYKDITDAEIASLPAADRPLVAKFRTECRYVALATAHT